MSVPVGPKRESSSAQREPPNGQRESLIAPRAGGPVSALAPQPAGDVLLEVANLETAYGPIKAVRGISFEVRRGEIVAVLGANGAGKTTLLKTISGVLDPLRGTVRFAGAEITGADASRVVRAGIAHVPEGREVFPLLSVEDNLLMGAYLQRDRTQVRADIERMCEYFPILRERRRLPAGLLSGGQQQMLALARALMARPQLVLLDEPSLGLSPKLTLEIFHMVVRVNREQGTTFLLVEQNAQVALNAADRAYVLENGRIVLEGAAAHLLAHEDIRRFYLGAAAEETARDEQRWKRKKSWR